MFKYAAKMKLTMKFDVKYKCRLSLDSWYGKVFRQIWHEGSQQQEYTGTQVKISINFHV